MITEWKYVVIREEFRNGTGTPLLQEHPILFPKTLTHTDVGRAVLFSDELMERGNERDIVAAGFCRLESTGNWACYGESESLKDIGCVGYKSRATDPDLFASLGLTHGLIDNSNELRSK